MADGFGIDKLEDYIDSLRDGGVTFEIQNLSKEVQEVLKYISKMWDQSVKGDVPTQKELKELKKGLSLFLQSSKTTTTETRTYLTMLFNRLERSLDKLDKNRFMHSANANISNMVNSGVLDPSKKGAQDNILAKLLDKGYVSPVVKEITSFQDKLMSFLGMERSQEKTRRRQFTEDLVEGLSRSKFLGGALGDLIRLGALFIGSWLKDKGPLGKALAVGLIAAAPVIATAITGAIIKGMTTLFTKALGLIATAVFTPIRWLGGRIGTWVTQIISAIWASSAASASQSITQNGSKDVILYDQYGKPMKSATKTPVPPKGAGGRIGALGPALGIMGANIGFGMLSSSTDLDPRLVHGASGVTQGALYGAMLGKHPYAIAAGAVIGGLYGLIKGHYEKQEELGEEQLGELKKKGSGHFWDNWFNGGKNSDSNEGNDGGNYGGNFDSSAKEFVDPFGHAISSQYGMRFHPTKKKWLMHSGVDIVGYKNGDPVGSRTSGTVTSVGWQNGYGNTVVMKDEATGIEYVYGHFSKVDKSLLDKHVSKGQVIGQAGSTGESSGVHVHFEARQNGVAFNPAELGWSVADEVKKDSDKFSQNVIDYWNSQGKDKGFLHSKAYDYKALANRYKEEYVTDVLGLSPSLKEHGDIRYRKAFESDEARDYANKRIAEYVTTARSIKIGEGEARKEGDIIDLTESASDQAKAQWARINKEFKEDATKQVIVPPEKQPIIDFPGTETCSKVLQNTINLQQQAYQQR